MKDLRNILGKGCEGTAPDRLHNDERNVLFLREMIALHARLLEFLSLPGIHIIQLDLAEIPVAVINDSLECLILVMEGEAEVADFTLRLQLFKLFHTSDVNHFLKAVLIQSVHQIKVYVVCLKLLKLLLENPLNVIRILDEPAGELRRKEEAAAVVLPHDAADHALALSVMVRVRRIIIVHTGGICLIQHSLCLCRVDLSVRRHRKSHTSEAQQGSFDPKFFHSSLFHTHIPLSNFIPTNRHFHQCAPRNPHCTRSSAL